MRTAARAEPVTEVGGVRLTHPDKILYPEPRLTKRDVALYLSAAADRMLPHLANRPLSLLRYPAGLGHQGFFQRHASPGMPASIRRLAIEGTADYVYVADQTGLVSAAQFDVLELHIWGVHVDDVERPDRVVFDFDPDSSVEFSAVRQAADQMRAALEALGLASFAMLTGGKGVHVVVPVIRQHPWPIVKAFAKALAERFAADQPERYVAAMSKARRKGRIFIDHFRNERTASAIAPYSPRARADAAVAWPVTWEELAMAKSANPVTLPVAIRRLADQDPWTGYAGVKQKLTAAVLRTLAIDL